MDIFEISEKYSTELSAIEYFEEMRWGDKIICPFCGHDNIGIRNADYRWHCKNKRCQKSFSVTSKTKLHNTRLPLRKWLYAFAIISNAKKGVSALQLKRDIKVNRKTAWRLYHKIRDLMQIENKGVRLSNIVELDSKIVDVSMRKCQAEKKGIHKFPELDKAKAKYEAKGFKFKKGKYSKPCKVGNQPRGEGASDKKIAGAVQREGNVVAEVIKNTSFSQMRKIIDKYVNKSKKKTLLITDEASGNRKFKKIMNQIMIDHKRIYSYKGINSNSIESFWAFIERQIVGQHHHVDLKYLNKYVAETVFKFNNRKEDDMFETLVKLSMTKK